MTITVFPTLTREQAPVFSWSSDEDAIYQCAIDDLLTLFNCGSGKNGTWRSPPLNDEEHTFYLLAQDTVGNEASPVTKTFTVGE